MNLDESRSHAVARGKTERNQYKSKLPRIALILTGTILVLGFIIWHSLIYTPGEFFGSIGGSGNTSTTAIYTPPASRCTPRALPAPLGEYIPQGDWCFRLAKGDTLHVRTVGRGIEYVTELTKTEVTVFDPSNNPIAGAGTTLGYRECLHINVPWSRIDFRAPDSGGIIRVRVGLFPDKLVPC